MTEPQSILEGYRLPPIQQVEPISIGLIHKTYKVQTAEGAYSLQALHPRLATDGIMQDFEVINRALLERGLPVPRLLWTKTGGSFTEDTEGRRWRLTTWLTGRCLESPSSESMIFSAAALLGSFHAKMADLDYAFRSTHPLHDTPHHLRRLHEAAQEHQSSPLFGEIASLIDETKAALNTLLLPTHLPRAVVHGDPKISNLLFDEADQACAILDLDTCNRHSVLVDIGDAVRSWCREGGEDEIRPFSIARFQALVQGYASAYPHLSTEEIDFLPRAGRLITLELTARFLTDTLEDQYFGWNAARYPSRQQHNLARSKAMFQLAAEMQAQTPSLRDIVQKAFQR